MFEKMKAARDQKIQEEQEKLNRQIQEERKRLESLSEKELLIEAVIELNKLKYNSRIISSQCDEIARRIVIWSN